MAAEHDDPGEGSGRRPHPTRRGPAADGDAMRALAPRSSGKVRAARLTDLAALGELSRLCQSDGADTRSLGPAAVNGPPIGVFSLFRLPLGRVPPERPHVRLRGGRPDRRASSAWSARRSATSGRSWSSMPSGWPMPATSATGSSSSSCARAPSAAAARFHVACADADGNVELLMQAGFMRYGEERILSRPGVRPLPAPWSDKRAAQAAGSGRRPALDALRAVAAVRRRDAGPGRPARGHPPRRLGAPGRPLARARARASPRSCASPTSRRSSRRCPTAAGTARELDGFVQVGVAKEDQPHYLKVVARPEADASDLVDFGLGVIAAAHDQGRRPAPGPRVIAPVRTYESPIDRRLEEAGFDSIASVKLLMKETLVRVAEPALVPAGVR